MRLKLIFNLKSNEIPKDYRRIFMSFIKKTLESYDKSIFEEYFRNKDPILKDYTFSVYFGKCKFEENIKIENENISMFLSTSSYKTGIHFYNAFINMKYKEFPIKNNILKLNNIIKLPEKNIYKNEIIIKTLSPIVIREHNKEKDKYYYFDEENAIDILKNNIKYQYSKLFKSENGELDIKVLDFKKTTILNYSKKIKSNLGILKIHGDKKILDFVYKSGIGSKRSSGFGMVDII
ncbi:CRISPR-associated endoribonuclease Cas6 [Marinitoga aeolica]|uniref:CRISPR-associated endoribonuclease Cas6 n=1 Tax=Marinitoga aeolica TaxID=2809031 RepID=A0ABY8PRS1_9BACT|nr:CRISPR-associated endoribonuclease Cas6 [Marinitoga aeolica]WGS65321.1 CRISPR-associated endoribonuclease Cas6 [Marinitoga aeolica]